MMNLYRGKIAFDEPLRCTRVDAGGGRWAHGYCNEYSRSWREKNREHSRKYMRAYMRRYRAKREAAE